MNLVQARLVLQLQEVLEPIAADLTRFEQNPVSQETAEEYRRISKRLDSLVDPEADFDMIDAITYRTRKKNTYFTRMAASCHTRLATAAQYVSECRDAASVGDKGKFEIQIRKLKVVVDEYLKLKSLPGCMLPTKEERHSKRKVLGELPADWREKLCHRLTHGKYGCAAFVAAVSGVRPDELEMGVKISLEPKKMATHLAIEVHGAKVTKHAGQPLRRMVFSIAAVQPHSPARCLADFVQMHGGEVIVQIENSRNFTMAVMRAGRQLWPHTSENVTAYCFRHAFSADAKAVSPPKQVAALLGHASIRTQKFYGQRQQSRNPDGLLLESVQATREVRGTEEPNKTPPSKENKSNPKKGTEPY